MQAHNKTPVQIEQQVISLYQSFHTPNKIAQQLNLSRSSLDRILKRNNIPRFIKTPLSKNQTQKRCSKCQILKPIIEFGKSNIRKFSNYQSVCKNCQALYEYNKRQKNPALYRSYQRNYARRQRQNNLQYKLAQNLRKRIREIIRQQNSIKSNSSIVLLGCSIPQFLVYLESKFLAGMSWDNYGHGKGKWNLDHTKPCSSFDLSDPNQQKECFHYTNISPMWAIDNYKKGKKYKSLQYRNLDGLAPHVPVNQ